MTQSLATLAELRRQQQAELRRARDELYAGILSELAAGMSISEAARQSGLSRVTVHKIVREADPWQPTAPGFRERAEARIADIERRYEKLVAACTSDDIGCKGYTAKKNAQRSKLARRMGGDVHAARLAIPTLSDQARRRAETTLFRVLEHNANDPVIRRIVSELDEATRLRETLNDLAMDF